MSNFKYATPKLVNRPEIQWADWLENGQYTTQTFELVPVDKIEYDEWRPSKTDALVEKIKAGQAIDPAVFDFVDGKFKISDGNHRTAASIRLGFTHVPAIVHRLVKAKPDFPAPSELQKELIERECFWFIEWLRRDASRHVFYQWKLADRHGYQIAIEIDRGEIGKEDRYVLLVAANGDDRKLSLFQKNKLLWSHRVDKKDLEKAAKDVSGMLNGMVQEFELAASELLRIASDLVAAVPGLRLEHHNRGYHHSQSDDSIIAYVGDDVAGYIDYSSYHDDVSIQMVSVNKAYRRLGVATTMLQELDRLYPDIEIDPGMTTEEGSKLLEEYRRRYPKKIDFEGGVPNKKFVLGLVPDYGKPPPGRLEWHEITMAFLETGIDLDKYDFSWEPNVEQFEEDIRKVSDAEWAAAAKEFRRDLNIKKNSDL